MKDEDSDDMRDLMPVDIIDNICYNSRDTRHFVRV